MRHRFGLFVFVLALAGVAAAQQIAPADPPVEDKRVFGVIPNNRTTEASFPFQPIPTRRKLAIAAKDSFATPIYATTLFFASIHQIDNDTPSFGQGMAGYAKRSAAAFGDQMIGNMMTEGFMPALLHEDPRFFRSGEGTKKHRLGSALAQIFVTRTDSGGRTFNFSEWGGNAASVALGNLWYVDNRNAWDNAQKLATQCATDAFSNVLKEFWPDVKRYLDRRRERRLAQQAGY